VGASLDVKAILKPPICIVAKVFKVTYQLYLRMVLSLKIAIIDFKLTYEKTSLQGVEGQEIIWLQFSACDVSINDFQLRETIETHVKPTLSPTLTPLCIELTGVQQKEVDCAKSLSEILVNLDAWFQINSIVGYVSWGNAASQFIIECRLKDIDNPIKKIKHFDVRKIYSEIFGRRVHLGEALALRGIEVGKDAFDRDGDTEKLCRLLVREQQLRKVIVDSLYKLAKKSS